MKRLICLMVIFAFMLTLMVNAETDFSDLNHWARNYVLNLTESGVFQGYPDGTFKPDNRITIAEFIKIVTVALGEDIQPAPDAQWYQPYVERAIEVGFVEAGEFHEATLNLPITRGEMAKMIALAAELEIKSDPSGRIYTEYLKGVIQDLNTTGGRYDDYIIAAYESGIITGYPDNTFKPNRSATRAEASVMINRLIDLEQEIEINPVEPVEKDLNFIDPVVTVENEPNSVNVFFSVKIDNIDQYSDEYQFKIESSSHGFLTYQDRPSAYGNYVRHQVLGVWRDREIIVRADKTLYLLVKAGYTTQDIRPNHNFQEGEKVDFRITVKKGNVEKVYLTEGYIRY